MTTAVELTTLPGRLAVCRLEPDAPVPDWVPTTGFVSITRTPSELSLVIPETPVPEGVAVETGWRALVVAGPLDFSLVGILASLAAPLAAAGVSLFAISTYDTDYVLVKEDRLEQSVAALRSAGHRVR